MAACNVLYSLILLLLVRASSSVVECPLWFSQVSQTSSAFPQCVCSSAVESIIYCSQSERTSYVKVGHCAYQYQNETVAANSPYVFPQHLIHGGFIRLPQNLSDLNSFTCGHLHREEGTLFCGRCTNGTGPSIYSFGSQCASCSVPNLLYYFLLQYVPVTIIFLAILWSRYSIVSPPIAHFIFYCNVIHIALKTNLGQYFLFAGTSTLLVRLLFTLNSLWTLDPFYFLSPPLCISERVSEINIPFFDALSALYPFILLLIAYFSITLYARDCKLIVILWKLCKCKMLLSSWKHDKSLIHAFATLFFISYVKFLGVLTNSMIPTSVYDMNGDILQTVSSIDPMVVQFSHSHLPVVFLSAVILFFILVPPTLLLLLYPTACFRRLSKCLKPRWALTIQIFTDVFYGSYKNGLNGTRDYQPFAGFVFIVWFAFGALNLIVYKAFHFHVSWSVMFIPHTLALALAFLVLEPHKEKAANISGTVLFLNIASVAALTAILDVYAYSEAMAWVAIVVLMLPHCVLYTFGAIRGIQWLNGRALVIRQSIGPPFVFTTNSEGNQLLAK